MIQLKFVSKSTCCNELAINFLEVNILDQKNPKKHEYKTLPPISREKNETQK